MEVEVLGCSCGRPREGVAATGYLVSSGETFILLDCGPGVATALTERPLSELNAIFISHGHYDHCADLLTLGLCLIMSDGELPPDFKVDLYLPPGLSEPLKEVARVFPYHNGKHANPYAHVFNVVEYEVGSTYQIGSMAMTVAGENKHGGHDGYCPSFSVRLTDGEQVLAYSGDTAPTETVVAAAREADLLICEATIMEYADQPWYSHMSAAEAGTLAQQGGAKALLLTHLVHHTPRWKQGLLDRARGSFSGPVGVAVQGARYSVRPFSYLGER